jgi:hypothetical protein
VACAWASPASVVAWAARTAALVCHRPIRTAAGIPRAATVADAMAPIPARSMRAMASCAGRTSEPGAGRSLSLVPLPARSMRAMASCAGRTSEPGAGRSLSLVPLAPASAIHRYAVLADRRGVLAGTSDAVELGGEEVRRSVRCGPALYGRHLLARGEHAGVGPVGPGTGQGRGTRGSALMPRPRCTLAGRPPSLMWTATQDRPNARSSASRTQPQPDQFPLQSWA